MPGYPTCALERPVDGVALLTLDNPDLRNAMSDEMTAVVGAPRSPRSPPTRPCAPSW